MRIFERRWYDNNFFDDGFHFRYLSRSSNKIVDLSERSTIYTPQRSIPKASRQIRGIANLLMSSDPTPSIYPEPVQREDYGDNEDAYKAVVKNVKDIAQKKGWWLVNEWNKDDGSGETILDKLAFMVILTLKHGISFLKIWPDEHEEKICTSVRDAFDVYTLGNYTSIYQVPFIVEGMPTLIAQIKANPIFDPNQLQQINPDNRKASSEIKEAYLHGRYGKDTTNDQSATLILNEAFIQEYVSKTNADRIKSQDDGTLIMKKRDLGSPIIRHVFTAGGVWLYDKYTNLDEYPYVDFRVEPGPLYGVPMIERFIPANKSLDSVVSRFERYTHTMVTGMWLKRRGENFKINNIAGGQVLEYDTTPPTQGQIAPLPEFVSYFIEMLTGFIEEQGVSTTTLGKVPTGVRANAAIESLKESEYANLVIASRRLKATVKKIATKCLEIADDYFIEPHEVTWKNKGDVVSFKVIGDQAFKARRKLKVQTGPNTIPLSKKTKFDIEIEQGMAYTKEGQKATIQAVMNTMIQLQAQQAIPPQALQIVAEKYLESYQFGSTQEFMDSIDEAAQQGGGLTEQQALLMKSSVLEALKDADLAGPKADQNEILKTKIGMLEALKESGLAPKTFGQQAQPAKPLAESLNIAFKDLPEDSKNAVLQMIGLPPSKMVSPVGSDQLKKHADIINANIDQQQENQQTQAQQQQAKAVLATKVANPIATDKLDKAREAMGK